MAQQPPLLRDVIDIKENISTSDFVLSLAEATTPDGARHALKDYVVTERLLENFDEALALVKSALDGHRSKAAYLHGSFGSGKSHFMAVLYALLSGDPAARARSEFDPVLTKHEWLGTDGKKFLLVPYHMLGAKALEQRVLGGYVHHVKKLHPQAPTPQVYRTDSLFADIRAMRANMGDEAVIRGLGSSDTDDEEDEARASPGPRSSSTRRSPPRRSTRRAPGSTSATPPPRPSCGPSWSTTPAPTSSPASPRTPPRTSTASSPSTRACPSSPSTPSHWATTD